MGRSKKRSLMSSSEHFEVVGRDGMSELIRFDVESHDGKPAVCIETEKGYWTPWYIAQRRINELRSSRDEYRDNHERLVEALACAVDIIEMVDPRQPKLDSLEALLAALEAKKGGEL